MPSRSELLSIQIYHAYNRNGITIGGMLSDLKSELKHGEFGPWVEKHLPFSRATAFRYMRAFRKSEAGVNFEEI